MLREPTCLWVTEAVLYRDPVGAHWSTDPVFSPGFVNELRKIGKVRLACRVIAAVPPDGAQALDALELEVVALPAYKGLWQFLRIAPRLVRQLASLSGGASIALLRLPGALGTIAGLCALARGAPFAVQLSGDPDTVLRSIGFTRAERAMRFPLVAATKLLCRKAVASAYVTREVLQRRYPARDAMAQFSFSNVELQPEHFCAAPQRREPADESQLVFCGSLETRYKGLDVLLDALALLQQRGVQVRLLVIGDGAERMAMTHLAASLGIADAVRFVGRLSRPDVIAALRRADLFVMPSRTEGLPRALVEAMAQGLACIASNVGGIPELLEPSALVKADDPVMLAARITAMLADPEAMAAAGNRNLAKARRYAADRIVVERAQFVRAMGAAISAQAPRPAA